MQQRKNEISDLKAFIEANGLREFLTNNQSEISSSSYMNKLDATSLDNTHSSNNIGNQSSFSDAKVSYIRSMFLQYLSCKDPVVKPHIESALIAIFRFNDKEKLLIDDAHQRQEAQDTITAITSFLGSLTVT